MKYRSMKQGLERNEKHRLLYHRQHSTCKSLIRHLHLNALALKCKATEISCSVNWSSYQLCNISSSLPVLCLWLGMTLLQQSANHKTVTKTSVITCQEKKSTHDWSSWKCKHRPQWTHVSSVLTGCTVSIQRMYADWRTWVELWMYTLNILNEIKTLMNLTLHNLEIHFCFFPNTAVML